MSENDRTVFAPAPGGLSFGQLVGIGGTISGQTFMLSAGTFVIGRDAECELPLTNEPGVSRQHTKIVAEGDDYVVVDCESRNGTLVNGKPVSRAKLKHGDIIVISGAQFRFERSGADQTTLFMPDAPASSAPPPPPPLDTSSFPETQQVARQAPSPLQSTVMLEQPRIGPPPIFFIAGGVTLLVVIVAIFIAVLAVGGDDRDQVAAIEPAVKKREAEPGAAKAKEDGNAESKAESKTESKTESKAESKTETPAESKSAEGTAAPAAKEDPSFTPVTPVAATPPEPIKARSAGKVVEVSATNGASVQKGTTLFIVEGVEADKAQIATLKESIAALEEIAKNNERAKKQLDQDKAELARLQSQKSKVNVIAASSGTLAEVAIASGATVKAGQVLGQIVQPQKVKISTTYAMAVGTNCALKTPSGVKDGSVVSSTASEAIIALPSGLTPADVTGARCN